MAMNFSEEEKKKMLEDDSEIYQKRERLLRELLAELEAALQKYTE